MWPVSANRRRGSRLTTAAEAGPGPGRQMPDAATRPSRTASSTVRGARQSPIPTGRDARRAPGFPAARRPGTSRRRARGPADALDQHGLLGQDVLQVRGRTGAVGAAGRGSALPAGVPALPSCRLDPRMAGSASAWRQRQERSAAVSRAATTLRSPGAAERGSRRSGSVSAAPRWRTRRDLGGPSRTAARSRSGHRSDRSPARGVVAAPPNSSARARQAAGQQHLPADPARVPVAG